MIDTIVFVNNEISSAIAEAVLAERGIALDRVAVVVMRKLNHPWLDRCAKRVDYGVQPSFRMAGQVRLIGYYRAAAKLIRTLLASGDIKLVMLINNDNVLTNHVFAVAAKHSEMEIAVLAEGIMNYQDIQLRNRDGWRTKIKPVFAGLLGLKWREPTRHLSGSLEPETDMVYSFAPDHLVAPPEKVRTVAFPQVPPSAPADPDAAMIVMTGLHLWMSEDQFAEFQDRFTAWLGTLPYKHFYLKRHPRASESPLLDRLQHCEVIGEGVSIEAMAGDIPAATVIGFCCTGLVTLRLIRPDLRCLDFGSDYYCDAAYFGDRSVAHLLSGVGVELVPSSDFATMAGAA